jgi:hypothetical protein
MRYQLCLGDESMDTVIDRLARNARAAVPGLDEVRCRRLIELIFLVRVRQTTSCGRFPDCEPVGPVWGNESVGNGDSRPSEWLDADPLALPAMFGATAAGFVDGPVDLAAVARRLTDAFRATIAPYLHDNPLCGRSAVCRADATYPLSSKAARRGGNR